MMDAKRCVGEAAEGHLGDKDRVTAELKGAALTSTWMAGLEVPESHRGRNKQG